MQTNFEKEKGGCQGSIGEFPHHVLVDLIADEWVTRLSGMKEQIRPVDYDVRGT